MKSFVMHIGFCILAVLILVPTNSVYAASAELTSGTELPAAPIGSLLKNEFVITESGGGLSGSQTTSTSSTGINLSGEYHRSLNQVVQLGVLTGYSHTTQSSQYYDANGTATRSYATSSFRFGPLLTFNFGSRISEAFFLRTSVARSIYVQSQPDFGSSASTDVEVRFGKRFEIVPQVSFSPYVYLEQTVGEYSSYMSYGFRLISASVHW